MCKSIIKKATKDLGKEVETDAPSAGYWETMVNEFGLISPSILPPVCRRAAAFPLIKHFCSCPKDDVRQGLIPMFQKWTEKEFTFALAWVIADAIKCCDLEDAPKFFDRFALLVAEAVPASVPVFEVVFARAGSFLDTMYASEDGEPRWHSEYLKVWDLYLHAIQNKSIQLAPVSKILDAFTKVFNPFLQIVIVDVVDKLCADGFAKRDEVAEWIKVASKATEKNDKGRQLADEIRILFC
eukprot:GDKJ01050147.1.p1 GENE.GDKJ01050147.1~~GDKJ01050147.1.p1  ORF type:complete len:261 (-),score=21.43 GDKJ01050147.1:58-777(-)